MQFDLLKMRPNKTRCAVTAMSGVLLTAMGTATVVNRLPLLGVLLILSGQVFTGLFAAMVFDAAAAGANKGIPDAS